MLKPPTVIPGLPADAERILVEQLGSQGAAVVELQRAPQVTELNTSGVIASEGQNVRIRGGNTVTLPRARSSNQGRKVTVILETQGTLRIFADGRSQVNGAASFTTDAIGQYEWISNGNTGWFCSTTGAGGGSNGIVGRPGATGPAGATGATGGQGAPGEPGEPGPEGSPGTPGAAGAVGPQGFPGAPGDAGEPGEPGSPGTAGAAGATGATGPAGTNGAPGPPGQDGADGQDGAPGTPGLTGATGPAGTAPAPGVQLVTGAGPHNDIALNADTTAVRFDTTSTITGFLGGTNGRPIDLFIDASATLTIAFNSALSTAGNRITTPNSDDYVQVRGGARLVFDTSPGTDVWRVTATADSRANSDEIVNSTATGNLGTIDISTLTCGGTYRVSAASSDFSIEGFTAKSQGFWFVFQCDDPADSCTIFHEDVTATAANRIVTSQNQDLTEVIGLRGIAFYAGSRWQFMAGSNPRAILAGAAASVAVTDVSVTATAGSNNLTMVSSTGSVDLVATGVMQLTGNVIGADCDRFRIDSTDLGGGFLVLEEDSASDHTVSAGDGMFWVQNTAPCRPMFTDDTNSDWPVGYAASANLAARTTVDASTTAQVLATFTVPANLPAGTAFTFGAWIQVHRGATVTANNVTLEFRVAGTQRLAHSAIAQTTAASTSGMMWLEGTFSILAAPGGAAAVTVTGFGYNNIGTGGTLNTLMPTPSIALTLATNATFVLDIRAFNSANVAACGFTTCSAYIQRKV